MKKIIFEVDIREEDIDGNKINTLHEIENVCSFMNDCWNIDSYNWSIKKYNKPTQWKTIIVKNKKVELLEALKDIITAYEFKMGRSAMQLRIDVAKQAIAKAEGKE
jgi:hypothetical protein